MNNEEKARAYDEALERARKQRDEYQEELDKTDKDSKLASILRAAISAIELAFPELVESDDERIRKKIVGCLRLRKEEGKEFFGSEPIDNCIAYLEKQKEQKHSNGCFTCDEYKKGYDTGRLNGFTAGYNKAMKEQKPVEWSYPYGRNETVDMLVSLAEWLEMDGDCLLNAHTSEEYGKFLRDLARKQVECKSEWS